MKNTITQLSKALLLSALLVFVGGVYEHGIAQTLTQVPNPSGKFMSQFMTIDNAGNTYYSYRNGSGGTTFTLYKYNGTTLTEIPNPTELTFTSFVHKTSDGTLYFFYQNTSSRFTLFKYNGTTLTEIPNPSGVTASSFIAEESSGNLLLRYINSSLRGSLYRYNGSTLTAVGGEPHANLISVSGIDNSGIIYLSYFDLGNTAHLVKFNGTTLTDIPNPGGYQLGAFSTTDNSGNVYFQYSHTSTFVNEFYKYNGTILTQVSTAGFNNGDFEVKDNSGLIYVRFTNTSTNERTLFKYNGSTLTAIPNPAGFTYNRYETMDNSGNLYLRYRDASSNNHLYKYDGSTLTAIANPAGLTLSAFAIKDNGGVLYFKYQDASFNGILGRLNGTTITTFANPSGLFFGGALTVSASNDIYLRYTDASFGNGTLYYFNGTLNLLANPSGLTCNGFANKDNANTLYFQYVNSAFDGTLYKITVAALTTWYRDMDGDGFGNPSVTQMAASQPSGYVANNTDCNDNSALEKPGQVWYKDTDNDGYAQTGAATITQCSRPTGYKAASELTSTTGDCNDNNAAINPAATEVCDGIDNNCNSQTDESGLNTYYRDMDGDGFGNPSVTQMACTQPTGYVTNNTDCDDNDALEKPGQVWYKDTDGDSYAETGAATITQCLRPAGYKAASELTSTTGDCNDGNAAINPGATEICDGIDNNCNSMTDEGVQTTYYRDMDGDGFGNPGNTTAACTQPTGYVTNNTDCDDNDALEKPGQVWYKDADNDNYAETGAATIIQCLRPTGYKAVSELTSTTGDCNDNNAAIKPGATEICDGIDNNCNSMTDEGVQTTYYRDMDGDGFGNPAMTQMACTQPTGYVTNNTDCDDNDALEKPGQVWYKDSDNDNYAETGAATIIQCLRPTGYKAVSELTSTTGDCNDGNPAINPSVSEICDGIDNNCNSMTDEGVQTTYYRDMDGDGFGNPSVTQMACTQPTGYVTNNTDCDDNDALEKPGQVWYADIDNDGYSSGTTLTQCLRPAGYKVAAELTAITGDCNDNDNAIFPGNPEVCDDKDNDCNGQTDEAHGLSSGWNGNTIGSGVSGSQGQLCGSSNEDIFSVSANGFSTSSSDQLNMVSQQLCGNGEIIARVVSVSSGGWAGITLRESLMPGSKKVALKTQLAVNIRREIRLTDNGATSALNFSRPGHTWLRLVRSGSTFTAYTSTNGSTWSFAFSATVSMTGCIYAGIFAESINGTTVTDAQFDNVTITAASPALAGSSGSNIGNSDGATLIAYPNPTSGILTLDVSDFIDREATLLVQDVFGQTLERKKLGVLSRATESVDLTALPSGIYWVQMLVDGYSPRAQKIILNK